MDGTVKIFEISTGKELHSFVLGAGSIPSVEFDVRAKHIVASGPGGVFQAINIETKERTVIDQGIGWVARYKFSPDGRYMASGGASGIVVWNARTWKEHRRIGGEFVPGSRAMVAFSRDSRYVAVIDNLGRLHFWDPTTGADVHTVGEGLRPDGAIEFTPDGKVMAAGADGRIHVFGPGLTTPVRPGDRK